jgi:hypothetical protein
MLLSYVVFDQYLDCVLDGAFNCSSAASKRYRSDGHEFLAEGQIAEARTHASRWYQANT